MRKRLIYCFAVLVLFVAGCSSVSESTSKEKESEASDYPNQPIEVIVPAPAGGSTDIVARLLAKGAEKYLPNNQSIVVVNQGGGNNTVGVSEVYKAKPDGYTIGFVPSSPLAIEPHFGNTPYKHDSFQTIIRVAQQDGYLYVRNDAPYSNFDEWYEYAEKNPGKFRIGVVAGAKNMIERLAYETGLEFTIVPYDGFAEATTALLGNHIDGMFAIPAAVAAQLESGEFVPIFCSSGKEVGDAPLLIDKGIDIAEYKNMGFIAPKDIPEEVLNTLHDAFKKTLEDPEIVEEMKKLHLEPYYGTPEDYQEDLNRAAEMERETLEILGLID